MPAREMVNRWAQGSKWRLYHASATRLMLWPSSCAVCGGRELGPAASLRRGRELVARICQLQTCPFI
jgi:hypothetical protein